MWRYRSQFGLSVEEYYNEPWEALYDARLRWAAEAERAKLESERQQLH